MKIKIFEGNILQEAVDKALAWCEKNKGHIATLKEVYDLKKKGKISKDKGYDTSTIYLKGEIRTATTKELKNLKLIYDKDGRVLFLYDHDDGLYGINYLSINGRFVGVNNIFPLPKVLGILPNEL